MTWEPLEMKCGGPGKAIVHFQRQSCRSMSQEQESDLMVIYWEDLPREACSDSSCSF